MMKKQFVSAFAVILCGVATFTSCSKEDNAVNKPTEQPAERVLTFEDNDWKGGINFAGKSDWSSLIDNPQYNGPLLYPSFHKDGDPIYGWYDQNNTELSSQLVNAYGDGAYWSGGIAVSNYVNADFKGANYDTQLNVPKSNGSKNFAIVFCNSNPTIDPKNPQTTITFGDNKARVVKSMLVGPTNYQLNVAMNGNDYAKALTNEGDYVTLTIHGLVGEEIVGAVTVDMAREGKFLEDWKTVDLSQLGAVTGLMFTMESNDSSWGYVNQPTYFAMDDVCVAF